MGEMILVPSRRNSHENHRINIDTPDDPEESMRMAVPQGSGFVIVSHPFALWDGNLQSDYRQPYMGGNCTSIHLSISIWFADGEIIGIGFDASTCSEAQIRLHQRKSSHFWLIRASYVGFKMNFLLMLLVALCFAAVIYVAMADDEPKVMTMVGKPLYVEAVTDSDGNVHYEQHER
ncbi:hypothetical protein HNY73_006893 [Argiope bruennichi]|uniref:Uncharacterized protein n=1 Tax=Argiope bruennichi TaxID=94029 RepID=A0A8T0FHU7_ARGBR|nr:hypothetical protein HNY73_006893 [Argiope bruennichi]